METLLPLANTAESMRCFHDDDLIEQIRQARAVIRVMADWDEATKPLVCKMWAGYEGGLFNYLGTACQEYERRVGHTRHTNPILAEAWSIGQRCHWPMAPLMPRWYGYAPIHLSHRSTLIRRRPTHYAPQWMDVPLDMPVLWPQNIPKKFDFFVTLSAADQQALGCGELALIFTPANGRMMKEIVV